MDDLEIAKKLSAGDPEAIDAFVRSHYPSILRLMQHLTRCSEDAEDLTQQAFLKAKSKISTFRGASSLRTWLHRVAFREFTDWKRSHRKTLRLVDIHAASDPAFSNLLEGAALLDALAHLPDPHREAFLLFEVEELSIEEISEIVGSSVGTVKSRLHHARKKLRAHLNLTQEAFDGKPAFES